MDDVVRALVMYGFLLMLFRIAGQRSIAKITTFDFVLLLVIGEATTNALIGEDYSMTTAFLVIVTIVAADIALSLAKRKWKRVDMLLDSMPVVIVDDGKPLRDRMARERVDEDDIMTAAREAHGLMRMDEIRYAVLERNGAISIVPRERSR
jgi:uncharacterized membrane protein YcaP (DUF421 family)